MEGARSNADMIKPVLLKAGLPLVLSLAGFMCVRIIAAKSIRPSASSHETHKVDSLETLSQSGSNHEDGLNHIGDAEEMDSKTQIGDSEEVLGLKSRIQGLEKREEEIEKQFLHYLELKEQESALVDLKNSLTLQIAYAEFLGREISSIDAESKRFEDLGVEFMRVVNQLMSCESENGLLQKKVKRLLRKLKVQERVTRESNIKLKARDTEILRGRQELETRSNVIKNLEDEVKELKMILDQFQDKNDLVEKDRDDEVKELIYLRWSNACLRHELMRNYKPQDQDLEQEKLMEARHEGSGEAEDHDDGLGLDIDHSFDVSILGHSEGYLGVTTGDNQICSKRRRLVQKLRRWVEGSEKVKSRMRHKDVKCFFGKHSVSEGAEEEHHHHFLLHGRKSCSSA